MRYVWCLVLLSVVVPAQRPVQDSQTATASGQVLIFSNDNGAVTVSFEEIITGSPSSSSIVTAGCMRGGTCDTLETYVSNVNSVRKPNTSNVAYDYYTVTPSWVGGTNATVKVNRLFTTARAGGGAVGGNGITTLDTLSGATQTFGATNDTNVTLTLTPSGINHQFAMGWTGALVKTRQNANTCYIDQANTWSTGAQDFTAATVTVATQAASDNSTKSASTAYTTTAVANAIAAVNPAVAVDAATAAVLPNSPTYNNGVSGIGATLTTATTNTTLVVDGYTPLLNDRVLVKNQASTFQNGVYTVTQLAGIGLAWILTRALDYDAPTDMNETGVIPVENGTANIRTQWVLTSKVNTVGSDAATFTQFAVDPTTLISTSTTAGGALGGTYPNPTLKRICEVGLGDGLNAIPAGTYKINACFNDLGATYTINAIRAFTDNNGTSTLNAANDAATGLLTGAVTATTSFASGTQSGTTTIATSHWIVFTFVADGTSKTFTGEVTLTR